MKVLISLNPTDYHEKKDDFIEKVMLKMAEEVLTKEDYDCIVQQARDFKMPHLVKELQENWEDNK